LSTGIETTWIASWINSMKYDSCIEYRHQPTPGINYRRLSAMTTGYDSRQLLSAINNDLKAMTIGYDLQAAMIDNDRLVFGNDCCMTLNGCIVSNALIVM